MNRRGVLHFLFAGAGAVGLNRREYTFSQGVCVPVGTPMWPGLFSYELANFICGNRSIPKCLKTTTT